MLEKKTSVQDEFTFLPPLRMMLSALETETREELSVMRVEKKPAVNKENVRMLIDKLIEKDA